MTLLVLSGDGGGWVPWASFVYATPR